MLGAVFAFWSLKHSMSQGNVKHHRHRGTTLVTTQVLRNVTQGIWTHGGGGGGENKDWGVEQRLFPTLSVSPNAPAVLALDEPGS